MTDTTQYRIIRPSAPPLAGDFIPDSLLLHYRTNCCSACGAIEQWSDLQLVSVHRTNGTRLLAPTNGSDWPTLTTGISRLPPKQISRCYQCVMSTEPLPADHSGALAQRNWAETLRRKYAQPKPQPPAPALKPPKAAAHTITAQVEDL
jgi:hypothetical protein